VKLKNMTYRPFRLINLKIIGFCLILIIFAIFGYSRIYNFSLGPRIYIDYPKDKEIVDDSLIEITGRVERIARMSLNNRKIYANQDNEFSELLLLKPGYNILRMRAIDAFGRKIEERLVIFYKEDSQKLQPRPTIKDLEEVKGGLDIEENTKKIENDDEN